MKRFLVVLLFIPTVLCAQSQHTYTLTHVDADPVDAHTSANEFAHMMGERLQATYPSKVDACRVKVRLVKGNPACKKRECFEFTWSCDVIPCNDASCRRTADYHFDRRGSFLCGSTRRSAREAVEQELDSSRKVHRVRVAFLRQYKTPLNLYHDYSAAGPDRHGRYWYLDETFIVAEKEKP